MVWLLELSRVKSPEYYIEVSLEGVNYVPRPLSDQHCPAVKLSIVYRSFSILASVMLGSSRSRDEAIIILVKLEAPNIARYLTPM